MKLPLVSGREVVKALERIGYYCVRQRGSHIRLYHTVRMPTTVPDHYEVTRRTLQQILIQTGLSLEELVELL